MGPRNFLVARGIQTLIWIDMKNNSARGRRVVVTESAPSADVTPDYADAFEIARGKTDGRSAEQWARDGFDRLSLSSRRLGMLAHRHLLGFRLGPWSSPDHIFGWRVVTSEHDVLHLEAKGELMEGHMVWRVLDDRMLMTTFVKHHKRRMSAAVWAFAGRIHRNSVPGLLFLASKQPR